MAEIASKINAPALAPAKPAQPVRSYRVNQMEPPQAATRPFMAMMLLIVLSLLGGILAMLARGGLQRWQSLVGTSEGLINWVFLAQVAAAVLCFAMLVRWVRS